MAYFVVWGGWLAYYGVYVKREFDAGASTLAALFLVSGFVELIANNLTPVLLRRYRAAHVLLGAGAIWAVNLAATGILVNSLPAVFIAIMVTGATACVLYVAFFALLLDLDPERRGAVMSLSAFTSGLGNATGAIVGGALLTLFGDVPSAYRFLALVLIAMMVAFALSERSAPIRRPALQQSASPV